MSDNQSSSTNSTPNPTDDEIKDPKAVLQKNKELLGKLKEINEKSRKLEEELQLSRSEKLSAEGKKDELINQLKLDLEERKKKESKLAWNIVSNQVALEAQAKGCINPSALMKLVDFGNANIDPDTLEVSKEDIKNTVELAMKEHEYLFKKNVKPPKDGGIGDGTQPQKDVSKMSSQEILEALKKLY